MARPDQETILNVLKDRRYNTNAVCGHAGVSRNAVNNRLQGKSKAAMSNDDLDRLWNSMNILKDW